MWPNSGGRDIVSHALPSTSNANTGSAAYASDLYPYNASDAIGTTTAVNANSHASLYR